MTKQNLAPLKILYMDDTCKIYDDCILLKKYYFPLPTSRSILYTEIEKISLGSSLHFNQKWGLSTHGMKNWFPLDSQRRNKSQYIAFHLKGKSTIPSFTPIDSSKVFTILQHNAQKHGFPIVFEDLTSLGMESLQMENFSESTISKMPLGDSTMHNIKQNS